MERRSFIRKGISGSVLFALHTALPGCSEKNENQRNQSISPSLEGVDFENLDQEDIDFLKAICPIILGQVSSNDQWPPEKIISSVIIGVDKAISYLSLPAQNDLNVLFKLISVKPLRFALTGVWADWKDADYDTLNTAMDGWSGASTTLWRSAYEGIRELVLASWYATPTSWASIGYPGPPKI